MIEDAWSLLPGAIDMDSLVRSLDGRDYLLETGVPTLSTDPTFIEAFRFSPADASHTWEVQLESFTGEPSYSYLRVVASTRTLSDEDMAVALDEFLDPIPCVPNSETIYGPLSSPTSTGVTLCDRPPAG